MSIDFDLDTEVAGKKILSIRQDYDIFLSRKDFDQGAGWIFALSDDTEMYFLIEEGQSCCEQYGYISTEEEDLQSFLGSEIISISTTDSELNTKNLGGMQEYKIENVIFININTTKGQLQLVVYNDHNGYYSHDVIFGYRGSVSKSYKDRL